MEHFQILHRAHSRWADEVKGGRPISREQRTTIWKRYLATKAAQPNRQAGKLTPTTYPVLHALLFHFLDIETGDCFPAVEAIAAHIGQGERAVHYALDQLEAYGFLRRVRRRVRDTIRSRHGTVTFWRQTSNAYVFIIGGVGCRICPQTPIPILLKLHHWQNRLGRSLERAEREAESACRRMRLID